MLTDFIPWMLLSIKSSSAVLLFSIFSVSEVLSQPCILLFILVFTVIFLGAFTLGVTASTTVSMNTVVGRLISVACAS